MASRNNAAVIRDTEGNHFGNEVFDWHHLNGIEREDFLTSIVITTLTLQSSVKSTQRTGTTCGMTICSQSP